MLGRDESVEPSESGATELLKNQLELASASHANSGIAGKKW